MSTTPRIEPLALLAEQLETAAKLVSGADRLASMRAEDVTLAQTPKDEVWRDGKVVLYRYRPRVEQPFAIPVLIVYAFINRYEMIDLQEDRSLVANLLDQGVDVYVVDWGRPDRGDRYVTLGDYVEWWVDGCVDAICERHHLDKINVLGICQGGTMSLCYAALHPERVQNLITIVTPVDFSPHSVVNEWTREIDADAMADSLGSIPGDLITAGFMTRSPFEKNLRKYVDLVDLLDDERKLLAFLRMEKWIFDTPDLPGDSFRQWLKDFYQGNKLIAGEVELAGRRVDLRNITMPVLNVYGEQDDVVPPEMAEPLGRYVGTSDYTAREFPVGHIGMYVSSRMQTELAPLLASWLFERA